MKALTFMPQAKINSKNTVQHFENKLILLHC